MSPRRRSTRRAPGAFLGLSLYLEGIIYFEVIMFKQPPLPPGGPTISFGADRSFNAFGFCDGSVKRYVGSCASVILGPNGETLSESSRTLTGVVIDSNEVEFQGLLDVLSAAVLLKIGALWVGVDCFEVISHTLKASSRYSRYLEALGSLVAQFDFLSIQAISRRHNKRADELARIGIRNIR